MRPQLILIALIFLSSCQFQGSDSDLLIVGNTNEKKSYPAPLLSKGPIASTLNKYADQKVKFNFESNLISHSQFIFLEYSDMTKKQVKGFKNITKDFVLESDVTEIFDPGDHPLQLKYDDVIGRTITINNQDRSQFKAKITGVVIIVDEALRKPYLAAVVTLPAEKKSLPVWANTSSRINPFPFVKIQDELISDLAVTYFDSLAEFHVFQNQIEQEGSSYQYQVNDIQIYEARLNEKYVLVQHNWIGDCESLSHNYSALFHVTPTGWALETEGKMDQFCTDLIDTDGDFYPEFLMSDFSATSIYEINFKGFSKKTWLTWSSRGCNC